MLKLFASVAAMASAALIAPTTAHAAMLGPDAGVCASGDSAAVLVRVDGFKSRSGILRVQVYGGNPADFLAKGRKLKRIDVPVTRSGAMNICVALPRAGNYAIAVRHDVDGNGKSGWNDGGGFSRNPDISLTNLKPKYANVVIGVGDGPRTVPVVLNYRRGLSIGPIGSVS